LSFFGGVGDRFWLRCAAAGTDANGDAFPVSSELWDTFYPYIGVETRRKPNVDIEWYFSGRIGCTAFTFDCPSAVNTVLLPQPGLTASLELGLRGRTFNVAGYFENMGWGQSPASSGIYSAASQMYQLGLKAGMSF
jgi:hypothetical protein